MVRHVSSTITITKCLVRVTVLACTYKCSTLNSFSSSGDEQVTEDILKAHETYVYLCGKMKLTIPRDAFITELCKGSLPPHYAFTLVAAKIPLPPAVTPLSSSAGDSEDDEGVGVTYVFGAHSNDEKGGKKGTVHHQQRNDSSSGDSSKHAGKGGHTSARPHGNLPAQESAHSVEVSKVICVYVSVCLYNYVCLSVCV